MQKQNPPVTFRAQTMTEQQLIPIARALGWTEPDPQDNKSIVRFIRQLVDHVYTQSVEDSRPVDRDKEELIAAIRLVAAYAEGLPEKPGALIPALELVEKFSSA